MDFFEAQDDAHKSTRVLIFLFALAVVTLVALANLLVVAVTAVSAHGFEAGWVRLPDAFDPWTALSVSVGMLAIVFISSMYKLGSLNGGGRVVAEALGGKLIPLNTPDPDRKRLLNVVAEMAIASGTPVPPVYELPGEGSINAFAAGLTPSDAVIGVTRGTIRELDRDQLQGVMAHEFSHILNGDMRLNTRISGVIYGIMVIGLIGQYMVRFLRYGGGRKVRTGKFTLPLFAVGAGLSLIGYGGTVFGRMIQSAVSRQREYLADASAVQFTRNPQGISGALKRIGGLPARRLMLSPAAPEFSHSYFTSGVPPLMGFLMATHPPLKERIRRIDPNWNGKFDTRPAKVSKSGTKSADPGLAHKQRKKEMLTGQVTTAVILGAALPQVGHVTRDGIVDARSIIERIGEPVRAACEEPYGARAVIYLLVTSADQAERERQFGYLDAYGDDGIGRLARRLHGPVSQLDRALFLPVVDLAMPALRQLSPDQYTRFQENLDALVHMDEHITLFEWALTRVLTHHLSGAYGNGRRSGRQNIHIARERHACELLLSALAHASVAGENRDPRAAFDAALKYLQIPGVTLRAEDSVGYEQLDLALTRLIQLGPLHKRRLFKACVGCIEADGVVAIHQYEVMRAIASALDCPMPPGVTLPGQ